MQQFSFDRLASVAPAEASYAAFAAVSEMQRFTPEQRVAGASLLFLALCRRFDAHPGNALEVASNILNHESRRVKELTALHNYLKHDLETE